MPVKTGIQVTYGVRHTVGNGIQVLGMRIGPLFTLGADKGLIPTSAGMTICSYE